MRQESSESVWEIMLMESWSGVWSVCLCKLNVDGPGGVGECGLYSSYASVPWLLSSPLLGGKHKGPCSGLMQYSWWAWESRTLPSTEETFQPLSGSSCFSPNVASVLHHSILSLSLVNFLSQLKKAVLAEAGGSESRALASGNKVGNSLHFKRDQAKHTDGRWGKHTAEKDQYHYRLAMVITSSLEFQLFHLTLFIATVGGNYDQMQIKNLIFLLRVIFQSQSCWPLPTSIGNPIQRRQKIRHSQEQSVITVWYGVVRDVFTMPSRARGSTMWSRGKGLSARWWRQNSGSLCIIYVRSSGGPSYCYNEDWSHGLFGVTAGSLLNHTGHTQLTVCIVFSWTVTKTAC